MTLMLDFRGGAITGEGADEVGRFTVEGKEESSTRRVTLEKKYVGRHAVRYEGTHDELGLVGSWELSGTKGLFAFWPGEDPSPPAGLDPASLRKRVPDVDLSFAMLEEPDGTLLLRPTVYGSRKMGYKRLVKGLLFIMLPVGLGTWHVGWGDFPSGQSFMLIPFALFALSGVMSLVTAFMIFNHTETRINPDRKILRRETFGFREKKVEERAFSALDRIHLTQSGKHSQGLWHLFLAFSLEEDWHLGYAYSQEAAELAANRIAALSGARVETESLPDPK